MDGKASTLIHLCKEGLSVSNLKISTIRRFCRLSFACILPYREGHDIVMAEKWKSHRKYNQNMDQKLFDLYFPEPDLIHDADLETDEDDENQHPTLCVCKTNSLVLELKF